MADLAVQVEIQTPVGPLLLEDRTNGYTLAKDCFATKAIAWRKQEVSSIYVNGNFPVRGAQDNVTEQLVVDITGDAQSSLYVRKELLLSAFRQLRYTMTVTFGDHQEVWSCFLTPWTEQEEQEWRVAVSSQIRAQVPRLPDMLVSVV